VDPDELLSHFGRAADGARDAVAPLAAGERRRPGGRPGQYALDLVADAAVLDVLASLPHVGIVSEESGRSGVPDAPVTVVVDPVDGSTNCSRGLPYWAISLCALDDDGPLCAYVRNQVTGVTTTAVRGRGAWRDGERVQGSGVRAVGDAIIGISGMPARVPGWDQFRALGSVALALSDVAAGGLDGYLDGGGRHAPWDYLGGLLACLEAGAEVVDAAGRPLTVDHPDARRQVVAAASSELLAALLPAVTP
jgi:myo-inositol-1(or 4)-monophosphatase